jgi:hypothetical protein
VVAVRVADVAGTATPGALILPGVGGGPLVTGELVAWCRVVTLAPVVVGPHGRAMAGGWLPDHVRLGVLEQHIGDGVIEDVVAAKGVRPGQRRRVMSLQLTARFVLAMTLTPASYVEVMAQLVGLLAHLPWQRPWRVPCSTVFTDWRRRLGDQAMQELFWRVAGPIVEAADTRWHGLWVCGLDGFQARMPDTPANRAAFGSCGTSDDSAPFPQARAVVATARAGRAVLGAAVDACDVGEQTLTWRLVKKRPALFGPGRVYLFDRNVLGFHLIAKIRTCGAHLVMRVKSDVKLHIITWLPDGSYLAHLYAPDGKSTMVLRVVDYDITLPDGSVSELFCLATTLLDHAEYPADDISDLYKQRWSACETTIGENKSTITDAGPSRGPILRSEEPGLVYREIWAWLTATHLVRKAAHAAAQTTTGVSTDQISFTTMRHEATRSMTQSTVTATTSTNALAAAADRSARAALASLVVTDRDRHSERRQKHRPKFPHTTNTTLTTRGPFTVNLSKPPAPRTRPDPTTPARTYERTTHPAWRTGPPGPRPGHHHAHTPQTATVITTLSIINIYLLPKSLVLG